MRMTMRAYGWFAQQWAEAEGSLDYQLEGLDLSVGERIHEILDARALSRKELADKLGITVPTLSRWVNEPSRLTAHKLLLIAHALGCQLEVRFTDG
jgi:DNA-binding Xre family transcriptional regulator